MPLTFVSSRKGKDKLVHDGFMYRLDRKNELSGTCTWRCDQKPCKVRVQTNNETVLSVLNEHTHAPDQSKIEVSYLYVFVVYMISLFNFYVR